MKRVLWVLILGMLAYPVQAGLKVTDGDSLEIDGKKIRLIGIDSPEYDQECENFAKEKYLCGKMASRHMQEMVDIGLTRGDKIKCRQMGTDRYKRSLSECYLGKVNLNEEMVRSGWAVTYRHDMYKEAEEEAKSAKRGIWQGKFMRPELHRILNRYQKAEKYKK